jgi:hypothetical protein
MRLVHPRRACLQPPLRRLHEGRVRLLSLCARGGVMRPRMLSPDAVAGPAGRASARGHARGVGWRGEVTSWRCPRRVRPRAALATALAAAHSYFADTRLGSVDRATANALHAPVVGSPVCALRNRRDATAVSSAPALVHHRIQGYCAHDCARRLRATVGASWGAIGTVYVLVRQGRWRDYRLYGAVVNGAGWDSCERGSVFRR